MLQCKRQHPIHRNSLRLNYSVTMPQWERAFDSKLSQVIQPRVNRVAGNATYVEVKLLLSPRQSPGDYLSYPFCGVGSNELVSFGKKIHIVMLHRIDG
jgi:hypothetical protein